MRKSIFLSLLCLLLAVCLASCRARADQRTGEAEGYGGKVKVTVTLNGDDITSVKVVEHTETQGVGTRAIDALPALIAEADSINVDSISGATVTSNAIKAAVSQAMGMGGIVQQAIPMDGMNATEAPAIRALRGVGMAATGRTGPGKDKEGRQVYSFNVVFASGEFEEDGAIRSIQVDQLEVVSPNLGGGSAFSGFPADAKGEEAFLQEVAAWTTKGAQGDSYMLDSGSWRAQMDAYEQLMVGKTVAEVKEWYLARDAEATGNTAGTGAVQTAAPEGADASTSATMSLQGEYGDILLAIERAWEDAQRNPASDGERVDTNTVTDATEGNSSMG